MILEKNLTWQKVILWRKQWFFDDLNSLLVFVSLLSCNVNELCSDTDLNSRQLFSRDVSYQAFAGAMTKFGEALEKRSWTEAKSGHHEHRTVHANRNSC